MRIVDVMEGETYEEAVERERMQALSANGETPTEKQPGKADDDYREDPPEELMEPQPDDEPIDDEPEEESADENVQLSELPLDDEEPPEELREEQRLQDEAEELDRAAELEAAHSVKQVDEPTEAVTHETPLDEVRQEVAEDHRPEEMREAEPTPPAEEAPRGRRRRRRKELAEQAVPASYPAELTARDDVTPGAVQAGKGVMHYPAGTFPENGVPSPEVTEAATLEQREMSAEAEPIVVDEQAPKAGADELRPTPIFDPWEPEGQHLIALGVGMLVESPTNPRKTYPDDRELVHSVKQHGILQPILVRPVRLQPGNDQRLEIVAGHRRFRAARKAELAEVPIVVRHMDDLQVLEAQLTENLQREGLHPLEEADGYQRLMTEHGYTVDTIAEKVDKSRAYVYARLKLVDLCEAGRFAFFANQLNASTALLVARIPDAGLQTKCVKEIVGKKDEQPLSVREAFDHIQTHYMLKLSQAPFSVKDEFLHPKMGACTKCPYRTGNAPDLFGDVGSSDVCTLPTCYREEVSAHWVNEASKAQAKGYDVLDLEAGQKLYRYSNLPFDSKYIELNGVCHDDPERRTYKQLLGDACPPITVAPDLECKAHELVLRVDALSALKMRGQRKLGHGLERPSDVKPQGTPEETEQLELQRDIRARVARELLGAMVDKVERQGFTPQTLRAMCLALKDSSSTAAIRARRGIETEDGLRKLIEKKLDTKQLFGLVFELAVVDWLEVEIPPAGYGTELRAMAKAFGLDLRATEKEQKSIVEGERERAKAESLFKKPEPAKKPAPTKPGKKKRAAA